MSKRENEIKHEAMMKRIIKVMDLTQDSVERVYGNLILQPSCIAAGKKMRVLRESRGLTVECLAENIGCSPEYLKLCEDGVIPPSGRVANAYTIFFNKTFSELFDELKSIPIPML